MSLVILICCLLRVIVRKKMMTIKSPIISTKRKFEKVSKPSMVAKSVRGSGMMAIIIKARGRRSQATEILIDIEFLLIQKAIKRKRMIAEMIISICRLVMMFPPKT